MAYSIQADIVLAKSNKIIENITDDVNADDIIASVVSAAIERADGVIDANLKTSGIASLPLTTVPVIIKDLSIRLAIYYLEARSNTVSDSTREDYKNIMEILKSISNGEIIINDDIVSRPGVVVETMYDDVKFDDDTLS